MSELGNRLHHRFMAASNAETLRSLTLAGGLALAATTLIHWVDRLLTLAP